MINNQVQENINTIRQFNRYYTRNIGVLQEGLLDSPYSLVETWLLYEIAHHKNITAAALGEQL